MSQRKFFVNVVLFFVICYTAAAQVHALTTPDTDAAIKNEPLFPSIYFTETINRTKKLDMSKPYWVNTKEEADKFSKGIANQVSILLNNDILAYYGHPNSRNMGILGRHSLDELNKMLTELAAEYEAISGGRKVKKAFYLIYGTVWPEGEIGILNSEVTTRYIEYGLKNDILVFIDHQIGRYDPIDSLKKILPWLRYPNVHLALDPEWRTSKPMVEIGRVSAEELNRAQQVMEDYIIENNIPGERLLVIHQFNYIMIKNREAVRTNFNRVRLVHCADGFGHPGMKRDSYAYNALASNMPVKGFKLFYNLGIPGAGYDNPLMTPKDVYNLQPRPYIIMYQ